MAYSDSVNIVIDDAISVGGSINMNFVDIKWWVLKWPLLWLTCLIFGHNWFVLGVDSYDKCFMSSYQWHICARCLKEKRNEK